MSTIFAALMYVCVAQSSAADNGAITITPKAGWTGYIHHIGWNESPIRIEWYECRKRWPFSVWGDEQ